MSLKQEFKVFLVLSDSLTAHLKTLKNKSRLPTVALTLIKFTPIIYVFIYIYICNYYSDHPTTLLDSRFFVEGEAGCLSSCSNTGSKRKCLSAETDLRLHCSALCTFALHTILLRSCSPVRLPLSNTQAFSLPLYHTV